MAQTILTSADAKADSVTRASDRESMRPLNHPLTPFVDRLVVPPRRVFDAPGRLVVGLETATHRFHRDLPPSRVWAFDGSVPGPTIEVLRGAELEVVWE